MAKYKYTKADKAAHRKDIRYDCDELKRCLIQRCDYTKTEANKLKRMFIKIMLKENEKSYKRK